MKKILALDFQNTHINFQRPLGSYSKVQRIYSTLIRNTKPQLKGLDLNQKPYLNLGCGPFSHGSFVNLDYDWQPGIDVCWDISRGLPFPKASLKGVFSEHCFEHLPRAACQFVLEEVRRVLAKQGTFRLVLPDAELYLEIYHRRKQGEKIRFPFEVTTEASAEAPLVYVNQMFRDYGHLWAYDYETIEAMLRKAGFSEIRRVQYKAGKNNVLLIDQEFRKCESLYVEAQV